MHGLADVSLRQQCPAKWLYLRTVADGEKGVLLAVDNYPDKWGETHGRLERYIYLHFVCKPGIFWPKARYVEGREGEIWLVLAWYVHNCVSHCRV